jgi:hypothetical protein
MKAWLLFGISTVGMLIFAGLYFLSPRTVPEIQTVMSIVTNTVVSTVTNEVVREVPKEVEKIVTVPAAIPQKFIDAQAIISNFDNCDFVKDNQVLFGMKDVRMIYLVPNLNDAISENLVRAKFELTLRKNNVPINPKSLNCVTVEVRGFWGEGAFRDILTEAIAVQVYEKQTLLRGGQIHKAVVNVWSKISYGKIGKDNAEKGVLDSVESQAEMFANDFLSANQKQ